MPLELGVISVLLGVAISLLALRVMWLGLTRGTRREWEQDHPGMRWEDWH